MKSRFALYLWLSLPLSAAAQDAPAQRTADHSIRRSEVALDFTQTPPALSAGAALVTARGLAVPATAAQAVVESAAVVSPLVAPEPFLAVGAVWSADGGGVTLGVRGSADGVGWSAWQNFSGDEDSSSHASERVGGLLFLDRQTRFIQWRATLARDERGAAPTLARLRLVFISPGATSAAAQRRIAHQSSSLMASSLMAYPKPPVVTRTEWSCPDGQITTHGTLSYTNVTHLIVHHTATGNNADRAADWAAVVRSIWNFHIFTNGWADLGYNYLVDPQGVVYEGRAGGDNVLGAHFSGVNGGTMGVSLLGTFTDVTPTPAALTSLHRILAWKAEQRGIDPLGTTRHAASGLNLKTISGHRDGPGSTECPGNAFYPTLPAVREAVRHLLTNVGAVASASAASFNREQLAAESIVAAFGDNLATATQAAAAGLPLPRALAGSVVTVRDSVGIERTAQLFFVSPRQINYLLPAGVSAGEATVTVAAGDGRSAAGKVQIAPVAPGLFAANADGRGVPVALALRIKPDGPPLFEPVARFDAARNLWVAEPIDLGAAGEQVFLVAYGTGFRFRNSLNTVAAQVGGGDVEVLFAGAVEGFVGLDQINVRLPRSLAGRGEVEFTLTVDGQAANPVRILLR